MFVQVSVYFENLFKLRKREINKENKVYNLPMLLLLLLSIG